MKGIDTIASIVFPPLYIIGRNEFPEVKGIDTLEKTFNLKFLPSV